MAAIKVETFSNVKFNTTGLAAELKRALDKSAQGVAQDFNAVTATWKRRPRAEIRRESDESRLIGVNDDRWVWNNNGTRPHRIRARNAPALRFRSRYRRKTAPKQLSSRSGGPSGQLRGAKSVDHPGNKASEWNKAAADKRSPELKRDVSTIIKRNT